MEKIGGTSGQKGQFLTNSGRERTKKGDRNVDQGPWWEGHKLHHDAHGW